jgi:hypothetical protein
MGEVTEVLALRLVEQQCCRYRLENGLRRPATPSLLEADVIVGGQSDQGRDLYTPQPGNSATRAGGR